MAPPFVGGASETPPAEPKPKAISAASRPDTSTPWDAPAEGAAQAAFEADANAAMTQLNQQPRKEEFPLDAFIVPEQTKRVPADLEGKAQYTPSQLTALADRLEKLSHRLRVEDTQEMLRKLARGDRLDAMLAGLFAGYLAGTSEQD